MNRPISLLLADDHSMVRIGLKAILSLEKDMEVIAEAEDGKQALEAYQAHRPDILLLDLRMPGWSGVEVVRRLRAEFPQAKVIMLTSFDLEEEVFQSLDAGADGYILKSVGRADLLAAIRQVHDGGKWLPETVERRLKERMESRQLSPRELEVLDHLRCGHSNRDIAVALGISENTVKHHVKSMMRKMQVADRAEAVAAGFERGFFRPGN